MSNLLGNTKFSVNKSKEMFDGKDTYKAGKQLDKLKKSGFLDYKFIDIPKDEYTNIQKANINFMREQMGNYKPTFKKSVTGFKGVPYK